MSHWNELIIKAQSDAFDNAMEASKVAVIEIAPNGDQVTRYQTDKQRFHHLIDIEMTKIHATLGGFSE